MAPKSKDKRGNITPRPKPLTGYSWAGGSIILTSLVLAVTGFVLSNFETPPRFCITTTTAKAGIQPPVPEMRWFDKIEPPNL